MTFFKKFEKNLKKVLTIGDKSGIIVKRLNAREQFGQHRSLKIEQHEISSTTKSAEISLIHFERKETQKVRRS